MPTSGRVAEPLWRQTLTWLGGVALCLAAGECVHGGVMIGPGGIGFFAVAAICIALAFALCQPSGRRDWRLVTGLLLLTAVTTLTTVSYRAWYDYTDDLIDEGVYATEGNIRVSLRKEGRMLFIGADEVKAYAPARLITPAERGHDRYIMGFRDDPKPVLLLHGTPADPGGIGINFTAGVMDTAQLPALGDASNHHSREAVAAYLTGGRVVLHGHRFKAEMPICPLQIIEPDGGVLPDYDVAFAYVGYIVQESCAETRVSTAAMKEARRHRNGALMTALQAETTVAMDMYARDGTRVVSATFATDRVKAAFARSDALNDRLRRRQYGTPFSPWFIFVKRAPPSDA